MAGKKDAITRLVSNVTALDKTGEVFKGFYIWSDISPAVKQDPNLCYARCLVLPGSSQSMLKCRQIDPPDPTNTEFNVPVANAYNVNSGIDPLSYPDIGMIPHTNDAAALDFIKQRYVQGQIYTEARPLLVAVNPFKDLNNTTDKVIFEYRDAVDVTKLPPHVFAIARVALENLHSVFKSQTIIVSGESGAGKTEATKQIMRYFAAAKTGIANSRIQQVVLAANPVLEAFGNAKTIRNNNSSRFGRFMQLQIAKGGGIEYGCIRNFLLEKSRILIQQADERSYHIFYQLLCGASSEEKKRWNLLKITDYKFIRTDSLTIPGVNDAEEWKELKQCFNDMCFTAEEFDSVFSIISGVLLLGNVVIGSEVRQGMQDAAFIDTKNRTLLNTACNLLHVDSEMVEKSLLVKISKAGAEQVVGAWKKDDAIMLKDSLAKAMFDKLFDWIVRQVNKAIEPPTGDFPLFMAMLDIFGFEVFKKNSLEQFFINITNEMLQKNFTDAVFDRENKLYKSEGISTTSLVWTSNADLINVLTAKNGSIMAALEDQCLAPGGSDENFLSAAHSAVKDPTRLVRAKVASNLNFIIEHSIGGIPYCATGFLFKNKDVLRADMVEVIKTSTNPVTRGTMEGVVVEHGKLAKGQLIGSQFLAQLRSLMGFINITEPHFIRCVKPNECKTPLKFVPSRVLVQMHSLSILEALQLRNLGYAYRRPFDEFLLQYRFVALGVANDKNAGSKERCQKLMESAQIREGWQLGHTMIFMKNSVMKQLGMVQRERLAAWAPVTDLLEALYIFEIQSGALKDIVDRPLSRVQAEIKLYNRTQKV